jgi:restriction alleviation protein, Lar family
MKARIDLKPCPFCGNKSVDMVKGLVAGITMFSCRKCKALTSFQGKEEANQAVGAWNERTNN